MQEQQVRARFEKLSIDPLSKALLYSEKRASMWCKIWDRRWVLDIHKMYSLHNKLIKIRIRNYNQQDLWKLFRAGPMLSLLLNLFMVQI